MTVSDPLGLAAEIVAAFVSNNPVPASELPALIISVHAGLTGLETHEPKTPITRPTPAIPIHKSILPDYLVCLDDGKRFKSLKGHLRLLGMTPDQYRKKWDLPATYPMVAPNYSAKRSELARNTGLGQMRKKRGSLEQKATKSR